MEATSTVGNLLSEIFWWKNEITQQVKRHADLSIQHFNSKLLSEGIPPPPCLLEDIQCSEAPRVLSKEDLISQILQQHPQPVIRIPQACCSLYNKSFGEGNGEKAGSIIAETHSSHKCFDGGNEQGAESGWVEDNTRCDVEAAPDFDVTTQQELIHTPGTRDSPCYKPVWDGDEVVRAGGIIAETGNDNSVEPGQADSGNDMSLAPVFGTDIRSHQPSEIGSPGAFCSPNNHPGGEGDEGVREGGKIKEHETCSNKSCP